MTEKSFHVSGKIMDVVARRIFKGTIIVENGTVVNIVENNDVPDQYILPGLIDSHIHIESSMLIPSEFARIAVVHGTVATVSDPHEIGNVLGISGVRFMIDNGKKVPFKFFFGAPSCVPATPFHNYPLKPASPEVFRKTFGLHKKPALNCVVHRVAAFQCAAR